MVDESALKAHGEKNEEKCRDRTVEAILQREKSISAQMALISVEPNTLYIVQRKQKKL